MTNDIDTYDSSTQRTHQGYNKQENIYQSTTLKGKYNNENKKRISSPQSL